MPPRRPGSCLRLQARSVTAKMAPAGKGHKILPTKAVVFMVGSGLTPPAGVTGSIPDRTGLPPLGRRGRADERIRQTADYLAGLGGSLPRDPGGANHRHRGAYRTRRSGGAHDPGSRPAPGRDRREGARPPTGPPVAGGGQIVPDAGRRLPAARRHRRGAAVLRLRGLPRPGVYPVPALPDGPARASRVARRGESLRHRHRPGRVSLRLGDHDEARSAARAGCGRGHPAGHDARSRRRRPAPARDAGLDRPAGFGGPLRQSLLDHRRLPALPRPAGRAGRGDLVAGVSPRLAGPAVVPRDRGQSAGVSHGHACGPPPA